MANSIAIGDQSISYLFIQKPWLRNTYLKFDDQQLVVTARNFQSAVKVINLHKRWIYKHYFEVKKTVKLFRNNSILFNGNVFEVEYIRHEGRPKLEIVQNKIYVHSESKESAERAIDKWLSLQTALFTNLLVQEKANALNKDVPTTKTRRFAKWGVCKSNNTITFNSYLCMLPADVREYIVSHEVAHLSQMNHSRKFWEVVGTLFPEYKTARKMLKNYDNKRRMIYN